MEGMIHAFNRIISTELRGVPSFCGDVGMAPKSIQTAVNGITGSISFVAAADEQHSAAAQHVSSTTLLAAFSVSAIDKGGHHHGHRDELGLPSYRTDAR